ncbi:transposase [Candidatus Vondammii sp. HM_W22]|uniref:transposase n=1 Tax=Candidatus Vondammii sp. HM_W22 TaxID=2687299 RepID=UPI001F14528A|nr:transposase [Candidatus Vondammii sp. HM_W22]
MAATRKHGVSEQSIYRWRNKYAEMEVSDVRELKRVKDENMRLKKLLAERNLEVEIMKEIQAKKWEPPRKARHCRFKGSMQHHHLVYLQE